MAYELSVAIVSFFALFGATNVTSTLLRLRYRPLRENAGELVRTGLAYVVIALPSAVLAGFVAPGAVGPVSGIFGGVLVVTVASEPARKLGDVGASRPVGRSIGMIQESVEPIVRRTGNRLIGDGSEGSSDTESDEREDEGQTTTDGDEAEASGSFAVEYGFRLYRFVFDEAFVAWILAGVAAVVLTVPVLVYLLSPSPWFLLGWVGLGVLIGAIPEPRTFFDVSDPDPPERSDHGVTDHPQRNVVVCVVDDIRRDRMSLYGYDRETTPFLDRLADRAVTFENGISAGVRSGHSIPSILTGAPASVHEYGRNSDLVTLSEELRANGYTTACINTNGHLDPDTYGDKWDWYLYLIRPFRTMFHVRRLLGTLLDRLGVRYQLYRDLVTTDMAEMNQFAERFVREQSGTDAPFFLYMGYIEVHEPYVRDIESLQRFVDAHGGDLDVREHLVRRPGEQPSRWHTPELKQWGYDEAVNYTDRRLEEFFGMLEAAGVLDETLVVVVSDHGELLGEQGMWGHVDIPFNQLFEVPMLLRSPDHGGYRVDSIVSGAEIPSLVVDCLGIEPSEKFAAQWLSKVSLDRLLDGAGKRSALVDFYEHSINYSGYTHPVGDGVDDQRLLVGEEWKLLETNGERGFYRYEDDGLSSPIPTSEVPDGVRNAMTRRLDLIGAELRRRRRFGHVDDPYADIGNRDVLDQLESMGYL